MAIAPQGRRPLIEPRAFRLRMLQDPNRNGRRLASEVQGSPVESLILKAVVLNSLLDFFILIRERHTLCKHPVRKTSRRLIDLASWRFAWSRPLLAPWRTCLAFSVGHRELRHATQLVA